jgi:hypothetical protein
VRRLVLLSLLTLAACQVQPAPGAFQQASPSPQASNAPAQLDLPALRALQTSLVASLRAHTRGGHLDLQWGSGPSYQLAGPYPNSQIYADTLDLLAVQRAAASGLAPAELDPLTRQRDAMVSGVTAGLGQIDGPQGAVLVLASRLSGAGFDQARAQASDALLKGWYAADTRTFFQVGQTSTLYRPVDAFGVGAALVIAGFAAHEEPPASGQRGTGKIEAGDDIFNKEMGADLADQLNMSYGLMTAGATGGRTPTDFTSRPADQAGIAQHLLDALDTSREHNYLADAKTVLTPFLDGKVPAPAYGYLSSFDTRGGAAPTRDVDLEADLLVLEAAHHYDRDDGGHFARLEEQAAGRILEAAHRAGAYVDGMAPVLGDAGPSRRSGVVTAIAVVVLSEVLADGQGTPATPVQAST